MKLHTFFTAGFCLHVLFAVCQPLVPKSLKSKDAIVCYANPENQHTRVEAPEIVRAWKERGAARTKTANIVVTYVGFTTEAQNAFQAAVDIWETLIESNVTIHVTATWQPLGTGVLGSAIWGSVHANFPGAQRINTWYPAALAEKMANRELNDPTDPDIVANFSSTFNWYLNPSGTPSAGQYDLITVVLHELGHGLGFVDSYSVSGDVGTVGIQTTGLPIIFDQQLENSSGQNLYQSFTSGSTQLKAELTSTNVFYNSPQVLASNGIERARIYAPATYNGGSSIAHLNEATYPSGSVNSLMTPQIGAVEVNHNPGPITMAAFSDMGWKFTRIDHESLKDVETTTGPFVVKAVVTTDVAPINNLKLVYNNGGGDTEVAMTATANPNEYQATIPSTGNPSTYQYYISVKDNLSRTYTNPGKLIRPGQSTQQFYNTFKTGPDTQAPHITHSPKSFIQDSETSFEVEAIISDNLGIASAMLEYKINGVAQTAVGMAPGTPDSLYSATIPVSSLTIGDVLEYRIKAVDMAVANNTAYSPGSDFYELNVVGLVATQDFYTNNFNSASDDFFGDGFSITTPSGFSNGAIHSTHPYAEGNGFPNNELNWTYQLKIPIRVNSDLGLIRFDEVVLIEPGASGSVFGDDDFFDFVVVEGSTDGGITWTPVANGYDSRANSDWLARYNSATSGDNSTATGDAALYRSRTLDLLENFDAGDEVAIRFRLYSDQLARGWGWAIDNLRIQIDETAPTILHDHIDFATTDRSSVIINIKAGDPSGIKALRLEYKINEGAVQQFAFPVVPNVFEYSRSLELNGLVPGDKLNYRIIATDSADNSGSFPADGFIKIAYVDLPAAVESYSNDFTTATNDFVGNFFTQTQPTGFTSNGIHTEHNYKVGFGLDTTASYTYTLIKPIRINEANPFIRFDEIALVEDQSPTIVFGTPAFNDYVIVEGSKDGGQTWKPFLNGYDATQQTTWQNTVANNGVGNSSLYRVKLIDMLGNGNFAADDEVLIRFRLFSNKTITAWGWAIDNVAIQSIVTGAEESSFHAINIYPNPTKAIVTIELPGTDRPADVVLMDIQGRPIHHSMVSIPQSNRFSMDLTDQPDGLYILRMIVNGKTVSRKIIKIKN
jgi:hypothetical protein